MDWVKLCDLAASGVIETIHYRSHNSHFLSTLFTTTVATMQNGLGVGWENETCRMRCGPLFPFVFISVNSLVLFCKSFFFETVVYNSMHYMGIHCRLFVFLLFICLILCQVDICVNKASRDTATSHNTGDGLHKTIDKCCSRALGVYHQPLQRSTRWTQTAMIASLLGWDISFLPMICPAVFY